MVLLILSTLFIGVALGTKFKVLILVPATALALAATIATGIAHGDGVTAIVIAATIASCALQFGYVAGAIGQFGVAVTLTANRRRAPFDANPAR